MDGSRSSARQPGVPHASLGGGGQRSSGMDFLHVGLGHPLILTYFFVNLVVFSKVWRGLGGVSVENFLRVKVCFGCLLGAGIGACLK